MNKSTILLHSIDTFYKHENNRDILNQILNKSGGISLRNLEWFITNYCKKNNYHIKRVMVKYLVFTVRINLV